MMKYANRIAVWAIFVDSPVNKEVKREGLRMDAIIQFGLLALVLWVIVENSPAASQAFQMILTSARNAVESIFNDIGNL